MISLKKSDFILPSIIILLSFIITFTELSLNYKSIVKEFGSYNIFILLTNNQNNIIGILIPIIPAIFAYKCILNSKIIENRCDYTGMIKRSIIISLVTLVFIIVIYLALLFLLMLVFKINPEVQVTCIGYYSNIAKNSLFLYCLVLILHTSVLCFVYALFSFWIIMLFKAKRASLILPVLYYHITPFMSWLLSVKTLRMFGFIFPSMNFKVNNINVNMWDNSKNIIFILVITLLISIITVERMKNEKKTS